MFDNKNQNEDYSSDELELMKMIKEYEHDEAVEKDTQAYQAPAPQEVVREDRAPVYHKDSALEGDANHTKVMSRQGMDDDKTLSIMPVGNQGNDAQYEQTQNIPTQPKPVEEDDDPRFELKRNKDKKSTPKKKKNKKDKKPTSEDERLNKIILILMIVAGIVVVSCGGYLIYNSFFRDSGSKEETEEVTPKKNTTTTNKKNNTTTTSPKEETPTTPKDDHSAEIAALQKLIDTETTNANSYTKAAAEARTKAGAYESNKASLEEKVAAAQKIVDDAEANGGEATEEQLKAVTDAQTELTDLEANIAAQNKIAEDNDAKASISFAKIEDYRKQITAYQ